MTSTLLQDRQAEYYTVTPHTIQVVSFKGNNSYGRQQFDNTTLRTYRCYVKRADGVLWSAETITHTMPSVAYLLSIPVIGGTGVPMDVGYNDKFTITSPTNFEARRIGDISHEYDEFGNLFAVAVTFQ